MRTILRSSAWQSFVVFLSISVFLPSFVRSQEAPRKTGTLQTAKSRTPEAADPEENSRDPLDGREGRDLLLSRFRPRSNLKVRQTLLTRAKFSVVDIHTHFRYRLKHSPEQLDEFVKLMDRNNIAVCVSLDGKLGDDFDEHARYLWTEYPSRFLIFANVNWVGDGQQDDPVTWDCQREDFAHRTAIALGEAKKKGASGLKLFKQFGLGYRNPDGSLMQIDDPRWDPIWRKCGELGLPIIIHTADPIAFFRTIDETNERWEELHRHPEWSFPADKFPSREALLEARNRVIARHPQTTFIGAHMANSAEDLATVADWLNKYPNLFIEFASRIGELGRQPYTTRRFILDHADRVLFGTDGPWPETRIALYWRFLETYDEYFPYSEKEFPPQGLWNIYGLGLPDNVLTKVYHGNAIRILPGLKTKLDRQLAK
ncbi:MAG: amidohydrolase [Planctomycetaceae bacterium]|nr:amidohydrolase [Planctomycetaceae bacterium]